MHYRKVIKSATEVSQSSSKDKHGGSFKVVKKCLVFVHAKGKIISTYGNLNPRYYRAQSFITSSKSIVKLAQFKKRLQ